MVKKGSWPFRGEYVIITVTKVNPFSVTVKLDEYNKEGMIHISEVSRKWVQDIKKVVKVGSKVVAAVLNVDQERMNINLSLKRVNKYDADEKMKEYKRELKADRILKILAKRMNVTPDKIHEKIGFRLKKEFEEIFKAFQIASTPEGLKTMIDKGFTPEESKIVCDLAKEVMEAKEIMIKKTMIVKSYEPDGVKIIKNVLEDAIKKYKVEIKYLSAPEYSISTTTKNAKLGQKKLNEASDEIMKKICEKGGEFEIKGE